MTASTTVSKLPRWLSYVAATILVAAPFQALLTTWLGSNLHHLDLIRIWKEILLTASLPFLAWMVAKDINLRSWFFKSTVVRLFGLYTFLYLILGLWALAQHHVNATAFIYALIVNLRFVAFFIFCALVAAKSDFLIQNARKILILPALAVILFGLLQISILPKDVLRHFGYGPSTIPAYQTVDSNSDFTRVQSSLRGANPLGAYLVLLLPALFYFTKRNLWLRTGSILGGLLVLFYTYSRSAWLGLLVMVAALALISRRIYFKKNFLAAGLLVLVIGLALVVQLVRTNQSAQDTILHTSQTSTVAVSSNEARLSAIKQSTREVIHEPLGRGPGTAGPASFRNSGHQPRIAENYFLQIGQEVGVVGMALIIAIMILVARELWQRRYGELDQILLASFIGLTIINLISHAWTDDTLAYVWWGMAGIVCAPTLVKPKH